jgi:PhzF family phenazine biosynthesis protein
MAAHDVPQTAGEKSGYDFVSRFFAPWSGIDEDPVTGSAHAVLGPYWAARLDKEKLSARQCSPRGGDLFVTVVKGSDRVQVAGQAVLVLKGELFL